MTAIIYVLLLRSLKYCEGMLADLDSPLASEAHDGVRGARLNIETLARLEARKGHVLGDRP